MADLTTLAAVKAYAGIASTDMDSMLTGMIARASAAVENFLQVRVAQGPMTEIRHGHNGHAMLLAGLNVTAVALVQVDGATIPQAATFDGPGWRMASRMVVLNGYRFTLGRENVRLEYTAGFEPGAIPADIEQAVIETVMATYKRRDHIDVSSKSLAGETISYITAELTPSARSILASYRRVAPL